MVEGHRRLTRPVLFQQRDPELHGHQYGTAEGVLDAGFPEDDQVNGQKVQREWGPEGRRRESARGRRGEEEEEEDEEGEYVVDGGEEGQEDEGE